MEAPSKVIASVLFEDPSRLILQTLRTLGYNRWQELLACIHPTAVEQFLRKPTISSSQFLIQLHSLGYDFNVLSPSMIADVFVTRSDVTIEVLKAVSYSRWPEVCEILSPNGVISLIHQGNFRATQFLYSISYPKWNHVHERFRRHGYVKSLNNRRNRAKLILWSLVQFYELFMQVGILLRNVGIGRCFCGGSGSVTSETCERHAWMASRGLTSASNEEGSNER